jgi:hypothetical protein
MVDSTFVAQTLSKTGRNHQSQTIELTFMDSERNTMTIRLAAQIAVDLLVPVLAQFEQESSQPADGPTFSQNVTRWAVGRLNDEPIFRMNQDHPYAMSLDDAKFCHELMDEAGTVGGRPPPVRQ